MAVLSRRLKARAVVIGLTAALLDCGPSRRQIDGVIDRSRSLIQAIGAYEAANGRPPISLTALVPKYLAIVPRTGLESFASQEFDYHVQAEPPYRWRLTVRLEPFGFKHIVFDPSRRYDIAGSNLRDGWVMVPR
jgi:hypothetical protein